MNILMGAVLNTTLDERRFVPKAAPQARRLFCCSSSEMVLATPDKSIYICPVCTIVYNFEDLQAISTQISTTKHS